MMIQPRTLAKEHPSEHPGLSLSRYAPALREGQGEKGAHTDFVRKLAKTPVPPVYAAAFRRWQRLTPPDAAGRQVFRLRAEAPVLVGMGEPTPGENGLTHHHVYGVPVLPGSSLKGVARAWCAGAFPEGHPWGPGGEDFLALFGRAPEGGASRDLDHAGAVDFLDALPEPDTLRWVADVLTPHHADYYQSRGKTPPMGLGGPIPVAFLGATGTWRVALEGPPAWVEVARTLLTRALAEQGVGAKTRAGHGRLVPTVQPMDRVDEEVFWALRERDFSRLPFSAQRAVLLRGTTPAALAQSLRAWILDKPPQLARVQELERTPARCRDLARWFMAQEEAQGWARRAERGDADNQRLMATVRAWLGEPEAPPEAPTEAPTEPAPAPSGGFGERGFQAPTLPGNPKKRARALDQLSKDLGAGGYSREAVLAAAAFLRAEGAKEGTVRAMLRPYGLEDEA